MSKLLDKLSNRSEIQAAMDKFVPDLKNKFPDEPKLETWHYYDLPRLSYEEFEEFVTLVGKEDIKYLTFADYGRSRERRGQLLISPTGWEKLGAFLASNDGG